MKKVETLKNNHADLRDVESSKECPIVNVSEFFLLNQKPINYTEDLIVFYDDFKDLE